MLLSWSLIVFKNQGMELFSSRWTIGLAQQSNMYGIMQCMCCIIFGVRHKNNSFPLGTTQPSSPTTKELHDQDNKRQSWTTVLWIKIRQEQQLKNFLGLWPSAADNNTVTDYSFMNWDTDTILMINRGCLSWLPDIKVHACGVLDVHADI